jgi:hypothetical protein
MTEILDEVRRKMTVALAEGAKWTTIAIMHNGADIPESTKAARLVDGQEIIYLVTAAQWHRVLSEIATGGVVGRLGAVDVIDLRQDSAAAKALQERIADVVRGAAA